MNKSINPKIQKLAHELLWILATKNKLDMEPKPMNKADKPLGGTKKRVFFERRFFHYSAHIPERRKVIRQLRELSPNFTREVELNLRDN